jgi:hypothetical protein
MINFEDMKPALREWYWLIQNNKKTEEEFTIDMIHRFDLLTIEILKDIRRMNLWSKGNVEGTRNDIIAKLKFKYNIRFEDDIVLENPEIITNI